MYEIVYDFILNGLYGGADSLLVGILADTTMILFYVALVNLLIWVFKVATSWVKF